MTVKIPTFVVAGNVNQGKSSIVAALAEATDIAIDRMPGTTTEISRYAFHLDGAAVFELVDTPGFQDARRALAWMRTGVRSAIDHRQAVLDFVAAHRQTDEFQDEVRLLGPVLDGASILYVVDASAPPQPSNEAEMEILRWTGQAGMALINRTKDRDHSAEWRPVLQQFFSVVRTFNAHRAGFRDRVDLLRSFREVREDWRAPLESAVSALEREWKGRNRRAAAIVADLLAKSLGHVEIRRIVAEEDEGAVARSLREAFERRLVALEADARKELLHLYRHRGSGSEGSPPPSPADTDLFSEASFRLFGLTRAQLAKSGAGVGAALGSTAGLVDGGLSLIPGALAGALFGAASGWFGSSKLAATWGEKSRLAKQLFPGKTGRYLAQGPVTNPAFAWVLLDRALLFVLGLRDRSHAIQLPGAGTDKQGVAARLAPHDRADLQDSIRRILKNARISRSLEEPRTGLQHRLERILDEPAPRGPEPAS